MYTHAELDEPSSSDSDLPECRLLWNAEGQGHYEALIKIRDADSDGGGQIEKQQQPQNKLKEHDSTSDFDSDSFVTFDKAAPSASKAKPSHQTSARKKPKNQAPHRPAGGNKSSTEKPIVKKV